jgi:uncharacterized SAM-binding protein YcdF (DUF218 family)
VVSRSALRKSIFVLAVIVLAAGLAYRLWLPLLGNALVESEAPVRADLAVVLAGDSWGHRILKGGELVREGYVPQALVSGPEGMYGLYESDLAVAFAMRHGYPEQAFIKFPNRSKSTFEEAQTIVPELRRRQVHRFLLVTSTFHTARAARIYRKAAPDLEMRVIAAPDEYFTPDGWWHTRQARKVFFFEWTKTVSEAVGF